MRVAPHITLAALLAVAAGVSPREASADTFSRGHIGLEGRAFEPDDEDSTEDVGFALSSNLELGYTTGPLKFAIQGFARLGTLDSSRNIIALQEAFVAYTMGPVRLSVGAQVLNWTAMEVFHPADVINSVNYDADPLDPEKLGEPMVELRLRLFHGYLTGYYMPIRIDPRLVPPSSRLTLLPTQSTLGDVLWIDRDGTPSESYLQSQGAVRFNQTIGPADVSLYVVDHSDRHQPSFFLDEDGTFRPVYQSITHFGMTYTQVIGGLILKLEGGYRRMRQPIEQFMPPNYEPQESHGMVAAGFEYGWTTMGGASLSAIVESQFVIQDREQRLRLHPFQREVMLGYRHAFNDLKNREFIVAIISDLETPSEYVAYGEYSQRISDHFTIEGNLRSFRFFGSDTRQAELILERHF